MSQQTLNPPPPRTSKPLDAKKEFTELWSGWFRSVWSVINTAVFVGVNNNVLLNTSGAALATTATNGFTYIPTCAGTPTGTPTLFAGTVPIVYDTTGHKLWVYRAGAWAGVAI